MGKKKDKLVYGPGSEDTVVEPAAPTYGYRVVTAELKSLPKAQPIRTPCSTLQLNPIVQPIALVPYNSMSQPVWQVDDQG